MLARQAMLERLDSPVRQVSQVARALQVSLDSLVRRVTLALSVQRATAALRALLARPDQLVRLVQLELACPDRLARLDRLDRLGSLACRAHLARLV